MTTQALTARAEALIDKMIGAGQHTGKMFDRSAIPSIIEVGLPADVSIDGRHFRIGETIDLIDANGEVIKSHPATDALKESMLVSYAVSGCQRALKVGV